MLPQHVPQLLAVLGRHPVALLPGRPAARIPAAMPIPAAALIVAAIRFPVVPAAAIAILLTKLAAQLLALLPIEARTCPRGAGGQDKGQGQQPGHRPPRSRGRAGLGGLPGIHAAHSRQDPRPGPPQVQ